MATKSRSPGFSLPMQEPRRVRLDGCTLVLPPVTLANLPPDGRIGTFLGIGALCFQTKAGAVAAFLHDLDVADLRRVLEHQRAEAELQLGAQYARRAFWWERP